MSPARERWRLLLHGPADGAWNMAVDEALLESCLGSVSPTVTLRLYAWNPPALSLGKSQAAAEAREPALLREMGIDLVRRPTGGRAVLHDRERTYSLIGRIGRTPFAGGVLETYRRIGAALEDALRLVGVDARATPPETVATRRSRGRPLAACFGVSSAHEITVGGRKLVGSAQLRRGRAFLQHGSILCSGDPLRFQRALREPVDPAAFTDLDRTAPGTLDPGTLDRAIVQAFQSRFGIRLEPGELSGPETLRAAQLRCWKHLSATWTLAARLGERELAHGPVGVSPAR